MAIRLPENLVPENTPLAWMIDSWVGGGILEYENVEPAAYIHEMCFDASDGGVSEGDLEGVVGEGTGRRCR